ncbi:cobyrinic acid a,c-diamide synthase, partial [Sulfolobus sp. A20-N-G8]
MLEIIDDEELNFGVADRDSRNTEPKQKLAIAYDSAFSFYYAENLDILKKKYELEFFSPLNNETVSDVDAVYIGGGYPELHLRELENSSNTKAWLKRLSYDGIKIYAECGGLMYLSNNLIDENDNKYKMVGVFDIDIKTKDKLTIGYTELESISDNFLVPKDTIVRGHEFHVSKPLSVNERTFTFKVKIGRGLFNGFDGVRIHNTIASYSHLHFSNFQREIVF